MTQEKRNLMKTNFYAVTAVCGHVGSSHYLLKTFAIKARNGKEASAIARSRPRVKHDYKLAIVSCQNISYSDFRGLVIRNKSDIYFHCHNIQDQERYFSNYKEERLPMEHKENINDENLAKVRRSRVCFKKRKEEQELSSYQMVNWDDDNSDTISNNE